MLIDSFKTSSGEHTPLSNFYSLPFISKVYDDNSLGIILFETVEYYYQAHKARFDSDFLFVLNAKTPGEAKQRGRRVELRADWESVKLESDAYSIG